jgi:sulfur carrier protein ThiS
MKYEVRGKTFDIKESLKLHGFQYDGKVWYKQDATEQDIKDIKHHIGNRDDIEIVTVTPGGRASVV